MWPTLYLPKGEPKFEKRDYWSADLAGLFRELGEEAFSGSVEILSPQQHGLFLFHQGRLVNCFYDGTEELQLTHPQILEHFLRKKKSGPETVINAAILPPEVLEALSALEFRRPLYRELETGFLDLAKLFETLEAKHFTGFLRFYHIRSHTRLGNILVKMNKITREQLQDAVRLQLSQKGALRLGDALVQIGAINPDDLGNALDIQAHSRKGSDVEIALAIFVRGRFLGGYSHMHKRFNTVREEILPQMVGTEVLLDITEGSLPDPIPMHELLETLAAAAAEAAEPPAPEPAAPEPAPTPVAEPAPAPKPAPPKRAERPAAAPSPLAPPALHETMVLRGEDLILDLSHTVIPTRPAAAPAPAAPAAAVPAPAPVVPPAAPAEPAIPPPEYFATPESPAAEEAGTGSAYWIPAELQGLDYVAAVVDKFMGPLGKKLLEREIKATGNPSKDWNRPQLRDLSQRMEKASRLILGAQQSRKLLEKINERLEG